MPPAEQLPASVTARQPQNAHHDSNNAPSTTEAITHPQIATAFSLSRAPMILPPVVAE